MSYPLKIIAVRPLEGCHSEYVKNLSVDQYYKFYDDYVIEENGNKVTLHESVPAAFYTGSEHPQFNVSAIVGKNGSGKSAVIDLVLMAINNIATTHKYTDADIVPIDQIQVEIIYQLGTLFQVVIRGKQIEVKKYSRKENVFVMPPTADHTSAIHRSNLFYTIAVNYSQYAYNAKENGKFSSWLDGVFIKNDGYQAPLVINPMRKNGDIDINNENHLVKARFISTIIFPLKGSVETMGLLEANNSTSPILKKLLGDFEVQSFELSIAESKARKDLYSTDIKRGMRHQSYFETLPTLKIDWNKVLATLDKQFNFGYRRKKLNEFPVIALEYISYKLISICFKYRDYHQFFDKAKGDFVPSLLAKFTENLLEDDTHITFKLRQAMAFLKFGHIKLEAQSLSVKDLALAIEEAMRKKDKVFNKVIYFVPPPIFNLDITLTDTTKPQSSISFRKFSSGQKQVIYSISSLLYHLINLNSIKRGSKYKMSYHHVNIILEEIELYFHPEMQRTYINSVIESVRELSLDSIKSINLCFVTHSPFILSDIPKANILFLDKGKPDKSAAEMQTFGGNIHSMLAHNFFLGKGLIGEFAQEKIQRCIYTLNDVLDKGPLIPKHELLPTILLIGEPFIREKLKERYYEKYPEQLDRKAQIEFHESELKKLLANDPAPTK